MRFPHHRFIKFLLLRLPKLDAVREMLFRHGLSSPDLEDFDALREEIGTPPKGLSVPLDPRQREALTWLTSERLLKAWQSDPEFLDAVNLLSHRVFRAQIEQLYLLHGDTATVQQVLSFNHPVNAPTRAVLDVYYDLFWSVGDLSPDELETYLTSLRNPAGLIQAAHGDTEKTYAHLDLRRPLEDEEMLTSILNMAYGQTEQIRKSGRVLEAGQMMGAAALARVSIDALNTRRELRQARGDANTLQDKARAFMLKKSQRADTLIPALEDLRSTTPEVIDADYRSAESGGQAAERAAPPEDHGGKPAIPLDAARKRRKLSFN